MTNGVEIICLFLFITGLLLAKSADVGTLNIVAVVDSENAEFAENINEAVYFANLYNQRYAINHRLELKVVMTMDNDTYGAIEAVCTHLPEGIVAILDLSSRTVTAALRSLSEMVGITHLSAVDASFEAEGSVFNVSINFRPPSSIMLQSIRHIVATENFTNVGIIYDHTFNMDTKPKSLLRNIPAQHMYLRMATEDDAIVEQLEKIKRAELEHIFLVCSSENAGKYLAKANFKAMMNFKFDWYVITKDQKVICSGCVTEGSYVQLTVIPSNGKQTQNYFELHQEYNEANNYSSPDFEAAAAFHYDLVSMLNKALDSFLANNQIYNTNYTDCQNFTATNRTIYEQAVKLKAAIQQIPHEWILGPVQWSIASADENISMNIHRFFVKDGAIQQQQLIGQWNPYSQLMPANGTLTQGSMKKRYRVVTVLEPPFVFNTTILPTGEKLEIIKPYYYNSATNSYYYGYCIELLHEISLKLDFEYELYEAPDGQYGTMQEDGSWNGIIYELMSDKADIAVAPLSVMAERENVIDFTVPYYDLVGITILMKKPVFEYSILKFMSVLETPVWACVFSAFIIVSVLLAIFDKWSPYSYQNNKESWDGQGDEPRVFTIKEGLWFCMTSLTPQGGGEAPRALSGRLVAATWWMFGFIMIATYTANLAAFLTVSRLDQPIESLDDLAKQFKTKYAPQASTSTQTYFMRMKDIEDKFYMIWKEMSLNESLDPIERAKLAVWDYPVSDKFTNMWNSMVLSGFPVTLEDAISRIKHPPPGEDFAFIGDATVNKYRQSTDCDLWEVGEEFSSKPYALAVQEGSRLKEEISTVILQLLNLRKLEDLKTKWWDYNKTECPKIEDESDGISIMNIGGVFLVIFIGIGLGLITLGFEYYWYKVRPARERRRKEAATKAAQENNGYAGSNPTTYD